MNQVKYPMELCKIFLLTQMSVKMIAIVIVIMTKVKMKIKTLKAIKIKSWKKFKIKSSNVTLAKVGVNAIIAIVVAMKIIKAA